MTASRLSLVGVLLAATAWSAERTETISKTYPATQGKAVIIDAGPLDVAVRSAAIDEIRLKVELTAGAFSEKQALAWLDAHRPVIQDGPESLQLTAPDPRGVKLFRGVVISRARVELVLPYFVRPDLSTSTGNITVEGEFPAAKPLRLRVATGSVDFSGWAGEVEARSTSGDLRVRAVRALDYFLARTADGNVQLTGGARRVRCDASSGDVRLEGLLGSIGVVSTSGDVLAQFDTLAAGDEVRIAATSGQVRVGLPPAATPGGEITSKSGEIRSAFPGTADPKGGRLTLAGTIGSLLVSTTKGKIELY
jgi:hypothetical protein